MKTAQERALRQKKQNASKRELRGPRIGYRQNLDLPSGPPFLDPILDPFLDPSIFSVKIKKDNRLKLDKVSVLHTTASFALKFPSLRYSVEK